MDRLQNLDFILHYLLRERGEDTEALPATLEEKQRLMRALMNVRPPKPASEEFLRAQDEELGRTLSPLPREGESLAALEGCTQQLLSLAGEGEGGFSLLLWQGDITRLKVDAIVNAANAQGLGCWAPLHACIDNCIHSAAGIQLREECNDLLQGRLLKTGEAMITRGYNLPARHVIHTVGPIVPDGHPTPGQEMQLASCYRSCLQLADEYHLQSIAFCCISTGVFHFPNRRAAEIAVATVRAWLKAHPATSLRAIVFNVFLDKDYAIYQQLLQQPRA